MTRVPGLTLLTGRDSVLSMNRLMRVAVVAAMAAVAAPLMASSNLPFIDDDYARALAEARARKLPLFIEAWAPW